MSVDPCDEGFDKAVLESMACGRPVLTPNPAFAPLFGKDAEGLLYPAEDAHMLASKLDAIIALPAAERSQLGERLKRAVNKHHGLDGLAARLVQTIGENSAR